MDGSASQKESRERSYPRIPSRTSTPSSAKTNSSSRLREMAHAGTHTTHKYHRSHCGKSSNSATASPRLSRETSHESRQATQPVSGFLQERLQRERRAESERLACQPGGDLSSSTGDIRGRDIPSSPVRRSATATGWRPKSDSGDELPSKDNGMGAKQMEQTVSTLHKQNFDLKLELFHRRERQNALEQRIEILESEQREMASDRNKFTAELEQRDKAVQEAVNIIVKLEAKVDELIREKEMVKRVEADGLYLHSQSDRSESVATGTPRRTSFNVLHPIEDTKSLDRMPSFLSEPCELTENLRNVVLQNRSSFTNLRQYSTSTIPSETNRNASPSLSVLSESSFMSVYGTKEGYDTTDLPPLEDVAGMDGSQVVRWPAPATQSSKEGWRKLKSAPSNTNLKAEPKGGTRLFVRKRSMKDMIELSSPLQKLERLEKQAVAMEDVSTRSISSQSGGVATPTPPRPMKAQPQAKTKQEKRDALDKVLTSYPAHKEFANPHTLPPTPDTVSSSVLRKHQNLSSSQDSFEKLAGVNPGESVPRIASDKSRRSTSSLGYKSSPYLDSRLVSTTAFSSRRNLPPLIMNTDPFSNLSQLAQSLPPRPRSAADTTSSLVRVDSFISDSDSDGGVDAHSEADSYDYWMRESEQPNKCHPTGTQMDSRGGRTPSPDLFSFPADSSGWGTEAIFSALRGNGLIGPPVSNLKRDPMDEVAALPALQRPETLESVTKGSSPAPPSRRSSLQAHTGSFSASAANPLSGTLKKSPIRDSSAFRLEMRGRSNSVDAGAARNPPPRMQLQTPESGKRNQYPPISGSQPRGRGLGLNSFFRRSGSESRSVPSSATEAIFPTSTGPVVPPSQSLLPSLAKSSGRNSVPPPVAKPWAMRPPMAFEDDFKSATPPPIMRNRVPPTIAGMDGKEVAGPVAMQTSSDVSFGPDTPITMVGSSHSTPSGTQSVTKRKWLGLGRMGSLKNRTG
ncbi:hypothetical protein F5X99DRAFT_93354 [Biscogniauxia marginata]|nr:hypothetical protein F5X99DRAFT_93354 [Biscogniauxia marginata]